MKKTFFMAAMLVAAVVGFTSCDNKKAAQAEETAGVLVDSIKAQAVAVFGEVSQERVILMREAVVTPEGVELLTPKYFVDLTLGEKAETPEEQAAFLGMYTADQTVNERCYAGAVDTEARQQAIAKLGATLNISMPTEEQLDSVRNANQEDVQSAMAGLTLRNFEEALDTDGADEMIHAVVYYVAELTIDNEMIYETMNGVVDEIDIVETGVVQKSVPMIEKTIKLIKLLQPYYPSLEGLSELVQKVDAISVAKKDSIEYNTAILEFFRYIKDLRGKVAAV